MNFDKLDTKADAEQGAVLHFVHPQLRHFLYSGEGSDEAGRLIDATKPYEPVTAKVRGFESESVRANARAVGAKKLKSPRADVDKGFEFARSLVIEINGVYRGEKKLTTSAADLDWFFERSEDFALQIVEFAKDSANFFKEALLN